MDTTIELDLNTVLTPGELDEALRGLPSAEAQQRRAENQERIKTLGELIALKEAEIQRASHLQLTYIRRFDAVEGWRAYGMKSCLEWVCWRLRLGRETARTKIRVARKLGGLPRTDEAFQRGELSYTAVRALAGKATPQNETLLIELAKTVPAQDLDQTLRDFGEEPQRVDPWLKVRRNRQGVDVIEIGLPPEESALALQGIDAMLHDVHSRALEWAGPEEPPFAAAPSEGGPEEPPFAAPSEGGPEEPPSAAPFEGGPEEPPSAAPSEGGPEEPLPSPGFGRAQAFVALAEAYLQGKTALAAVHPGRYEVLLKVDREVLSRRREGRGELLDGTALSAETTRRLACGSSWIELAEDEHGNPLDMGRRTRRVTAALRRALRSRDKHCRWPGCRLSVLLAPHHLKHWAEGGETKLPNLVLLCSHHHFLVHEGGFGIELSADGSVRCADPSGSPIVPLPGGAW